MKNVVSLDNKRLGIVYEDNKEAITECVQIAVAKAADVLGHEKFIHAICSRDRHPACAKLAA